MYTDLVVEDFGVLGYQLFDPRSMGTLNSRMKEPLQPSYPPTQQRTPLLLVHHHRRRMIVVVSALPARSLVAMQVPSWLYISVDHLSEEAALTHDSTSDRLSIWYSLELETVL